MNEPIIGIDLGTTNSEVAIVQNGKVTVIDANGKKILPSAVGLSPDDTLLVGEAAKNQYALYPDRTVLSIKRRMGSQEKVMLADTAYSPQEISAIILKHLKSTAENYLQKQVKKAVITVPAYFSDAQRQATREAGELAGLEVVRIINEPTAAALAYGGNGKENQKRVLVYDLGGGTFDVSVVCIQNQVVEVLSSTGNNHLGGDDFDLKIIEFIEKYLAEQGIDISSSSQAQGRIRRAAENTKIILSDHPFALIEEEYLTEQDGKPFHLSLELSRESYEEMIMPFIHETLEAVNNALHDANLMASQIDEILLVGGSTRTPVIAEKISEIFDERPRAEIDPELCVATGAAIAAAMIAGEKCDAVLVDVTPYTYGTSFLGLLHDFPYPHVYKPIIQKNTPLPVTKAEVFFTCHDNQEKIIVDVYQGENIDALQNIEIGKFTVEGLSKVPEGNPIIISFRLDLDGILHVSAKEKRTGLENKLTINNAISQFTTNEMTEAKERLNQLFREEFSVQDQQNTSYQSKAQELITQAEQILNKVTAEDQEDLINLIEDIKDALDINNEQTLATLVDKLSDMLFYLQANVA